MFFNYFIIKEFVHNFIILYFTLFYYLNVNSAKNSGNIIFVILVLLKTKLSFLSVVTYLCCKTILTRAIVTSRIQFICMLLF